GVRKTTDNLEAYDAVLRGVASYFRTTKEDNLQAQQLFETAIALDPQYAEAYVRLGWTYYLEWGWRWSSDPHTLERAFAQAQQALVRDDSSALAHGLLGALYAAKGQYDQALAEIAQALALDPNAADTYSLRAEVLNYAGRADEALRMVEHAMRLNPRSPPGYYLHNLGWAYFSLGRYTDAIATLNSLLARYPNWWSAYHILSLSYLLQWTAQQNPDPHTLVHAVEAAQRTITLHPSHVIGHALLGTAYMMQRQYDQAIAEAKQVIAFGPNVAGGYALLADILSRIGRADEALGMVEQALRREPLFADSHLAWVGSAYYFAGKPELAIAPLQRYLRRYPQSLSVHLTLAAAYSEVGQEAEAQKEIAEVLRINPNFSLEVHKEREPLKDHATLERHIAVLRKAGLK
ncbi:MAG: tetratricopeptide repeat protein, partial [Candidatus Binatia bacterium]